MARFGLELGRKDILPLLTPSVAMVLCAGLLGSAADTGPPGPRWSTAQLVQLRHWIAAAPLEGLAAPATAELDAAIASGRKAQINPAATRLATELARLQLTGAVRPQDRPDWYIDDPDRAYPIERELAAALAQDRLGDFLAGLLPTHPDYAALRSALAVEADPARRETIARNMERWRWLPRDLGRDYILTNAAAFDVALWRGGAQVQRWVTISGRAETPTPTLMATATGVNFNPWWEVPESISSVSRMSRRLGYVKVGKRYRQRPGPRNSLGRMKVVMINRHNIYLHDTPSRSLFGASQRAFSHGCIRVQDALGFAATVLGPAITPERLDKILADDASVTVPLPKKLPVYVTYFTVDTDLQGRLRFHRDIYGRDRHIAAIALPVPTRLAMR